MASIRSFRSSSTSAAAAAKQRHDTQRQQPPLSPTLSATTTASQLDLGDDGPAIIISRADLRASMLAQESLLNAAKGYRNALVALSSASTVFASALEECARVKGAGGDSGEQLLAASGLQYIVANSGQILSDTLYRSFEIPLMHAYDAYLAVTTSRHAEYEQVLADKTALIRQTEKENLRQGRKKNRDLAQFRRALEKLQEQVREVESVKRAYYNEVLESEEECWELVKSKVALILRSTLDLSDRLASKATSDPLVESMLNEHPDPFDSYRNENEAERDVFTVLPPLGMSLGMSIGGSTGGSAAASVSGGNRKHIGEVDDGGPQAGAEGTPRQSKSGRSMGVLSPSEVLGIDSTGEEDVQTPRRSAAAPLSVPTCHVVRDDTEPSSASDVSISPSSTDTGEPGRAQLGTDTDSPTATKSATTGGASDSPTRAQQNAAAAPSADTFDNATTTLAGRTRPNSPPPPAAAAAAAAAAQRKSLFRSPIKSRRRSKTAGKSHGKTAEDARLSRVSEDTAPMAANVDPMAGDWSTNGGNDFAYARGIAHGMEEEGGWDSG